MRLIAAVVVLVLGVQWAQAASWWGNTASVAPAPPATSVVIGAYYGGFEGTGSCSLPNSFESWLAAPGGSTYWLLYNPGGQAAPGFQPSLSSMESFLANNQCGFGPSRPQEVSVAIHDTAANILAGNYDTYLTNLGIALAADAPKAIVRLMWEFNASFSYYFPGNGCTGGNNGWTCSNYASAFQHQVTLIRAQAPNIKIEWNTQNCSTISATCTDPIPSYPGDSFVDIIGEDSYDTCCAGGNPSSDWATFWTASATNGRALAWQASFAQAHGKQMSLGETGVGCASENTTNFNCVSPAALNDSHGAGIENFLWPWVKNSASGGNGYQPYLYFDYWNNNTGNYCGEITGGATSDCPNGGPSFASTPPVSFASSYMIPQSAQAFWLAWANAAPASFYVATTGSDSNAGTLAAPFLTLGKCQTAMQPSGSVKTCTLRGGTYTSANYNGSGCPPFGVNAIYLDTADSGETWTYYVPDGVNSAILQGSTQFGFCILGNNGVTSNITINGLKFTGWSGGAVEIGGTGSHNVTGTTIKNNIVSGNSLNGTQYSGFNVIGAAPNTTISNNYCYNLVNMCVGANDLNNGSTFFLGGLNNLLITGNIAVNTCSGNTDCGAYYIEDYGDGGANNFSTNIKITNNYCNNVSNNGAEGNQCVYLDNAASNVTITGNVLGPGMGNSCVQLHGSMNVTAKNNLCDMKTGSYVFYQPNCAAVNGSVIGLSTSMASNFWQTNILVGNSSGTAGGNGYWNVNGGNNPSNTYTYCNSPYGNPGGGTSSPPNNLTISGNKYWNFGTGGITTGGSGGSGGDTSPSTGNPGITCWKATIATPPSGWTTLSQSWGPNGTTNPAQLPGSPTTVTPSWGPSC